MPSCFRLLEHLIRLAASRTFCTAGKSRPIRTAIMAMTTNSSISVKAVRSCLGKWVMAVATPLHSCQACAWQSVAKTPGKIGLLATKVDKLPCGEWFHECRRGQDRLIDQDPREKLTRLKKV